MIEGAHHLKAFWFLMGFLSNLHYYTCNFIYSGKNILELEKERYVKECLDIYAFCNLIAQGM